MFHLCKRKITGFGYLYKLLFILGLWDCAAFRAAIGGGAEVVAAGGAMAILEAMSSSARGVKFQDAP